VDQGEKPVTNRALATVTVMDDRKNFEALVVRHQAAVCAVAYAVLRDRGRSEEVAQEAFIVAWHRPPPDGTVTVAWVCGIARNLARNAAQRRQEVAMDREPEAPGPDPRDQLIEREDAARARAALAALPHRYREAVVLYYRGEQSMQEVAAALGISEASARQRVHRGRERLRTAVASVEAALRATRPGPAFTAACVAAWIARGPAIAEASPVGAAGTGAARVAWLAAPVVAAGLAVGVWAVVRAGDAPTAVDSSATSSAGTAGSGRGPAARAALAPAQRRFPPMRRGTAAPPAGPEADGSGAPRGTSAPVDLDFANTSRSLLLGLLAEVMDTPILLDGDFTERTDLKIKEAPALDVFDGLVADAGATRVEVPALRVVPAGTASAAALGGPPISASFQAAPLADVIAMLAEPLAMPIGLGRDLPAPPPTVTIELSAVPAGEALDRVLAAVGLGCEATTGFVIAPAPE
jgi:RNA polymerase sigma factor (sigma-70 family)